MSESDSKLTYQERLQLCRKAGIHMRDIRRRADRRAAPLIARAEALWVDLLGENEEG